MYIKIKLINHGKKLWKNIKVYLIIMNCKLLHHKMKNLQKNYKLKVFLILNFSKLEMLVKRKLLKLHLLKNIQ